MKQVKKMHAMHTETINSYVYVVSWNIALMQFMAFHEMK